MDSVVKKLSSCGDCWQDLIYCLSVEHWLNPGITDLGLQIMRTLQCHASQTSARLLLEAVRERAEDIEKYMCEQLLKGL